MTQYKLCPTELTAEMAKESGVTSRQYSWLLAAAPNIEYVLASELEELIQELRLQADDDRIGCQGELADRADWCVDKLLALIAKHKGE